MSGNRARLIVAAVLFGAWAALAAAGRTDIAPLVDFIKYTLVGLAGHALNRGNPK